MFYRQQSPTFSICLLLQLRSLEQHRHRKVLKAGAQEVVINFELFPIKNNLIY